ncbi:hypothetical protein RF11_00332 [Thelohanellus kitauei]|uniref:Uncharacterized protein n=1 Tax=Thelohanellus kitauei TaxID=669202 RepID=A0A0C2MKN0_THEKT|nr:hypothetical protein RF11_00332 [Thelohanellus kitauei]
MDDDTLKHNQCESIYVQFATMLDQLIDFVKSDALIEGKPLPKPDHEELALCIYDHLLILADCFNEKLCDHLNIAQSFSALINARASFSVKEYLGSAISKDLQKQHTETISSASFNCNITAPIPKYDAPVVTIMGLYSSKCFKDFKKFDKDHKALGFILANMMLI